MSDLNIIQRAIVREEAMTVLKKYWPTISAVAGGALAFLLPSITAYVTAHPKSTVGVLLGCVIAAYHSTAPKDAQ